MSRWVLNSSWSIWSLDLRQRRSSNVIIVPGNFGFINNSASLYGRMSIEQLSEYRVILLSQGICGVSSARVEWGLGDVLPEPVGVCRLYMTISDLTPGVAGLLKV